MTICQRTVVLINPLGTKSMELSYWASIRIDPPTPQGRPMMVQCRGHRSVAGSGATGWLSSHPLFSETTRKPPDLFSGKIWTGARPREGLPLELL